MKEEQGVSVIIPAYNEEKYLADTLKNISFSWVREIIVINDGSTDRTSAIARGFNGIKLIDFKSNRGKWAAVKKGLELSRGEIIVLLDADLGESVRDIERLVKPVLENEVELTIALIPIKGGGQGLVRRLAAAGLKVLTGDGMAAPLSGQRVFRRYLLEVFEFHEMAFKGFGLEIAMDIVIIRRKIKYREIPCKLEHRVTGRCLKDYLHRGRQFMDIALTLLKYRRFY